MDCFRHMPPSGERCGAMKTRHIDVETSRRMCDISAFRNNQTNATLGSPAVVVSNGLIGDTSG